MCGLDALLIAQRTRRNRASRSGLADSQVVASWLARFGSRSVLDCLEVGDSDYYSQRFKGVAADAAVPAEGAGRPVPAPETAASGQRWTFY